MKEVIKVQLSSNMILNETEAEVLQEFLLSQKIEDVFSENYLILYNFAIDCRYADYIQSELLCYLLPFYYKTMEQAIFIENRIAADIYSAFNESIFKNRNVFIEAVGEEKYKKMMNHYVRCTCRKIEEKNLSMVEWISLFNTTIALDDHNIRRIFDKIRNGSLAMKYSFFQYLSVLLFKESDNLLAANEFKAFWSSKIWNFDDEGGLFWSRESIAFYDKNINQESIMELFGEITPVLSDCFDEETIECISEEMDRSFCKGIFQKRKEEYLTKISSNSEEYKYWDKTF